jgi:RND family efflux transporter MFP subunit
MKSSEPQTEFEENISPEYIDKPRRRQRRWLWLLLVLPLLGGGFLAWRSLAKMGSKTEAGAQTPPPAVPVKISTTEIGTIDDSSDYVASLESRRSVTLQPRIQGQVTQIFVRSGDVVAQGAPIIQVDPREQQAALSGVNAGVLAAQSQLENARATLASLQADRLSTVADLKLNQQEYQRYASLADVGAVSRQVKEQYANKLASAQANLGAIDSKIKAQQASVTQSQKAIQQAQANTDAQQVQLQYYKITAPFAGTVGEVPIKVGDFANTSTKLATITQNQPLEVNISVPLEKGSQLRKGLPVEILNAQGQTLGMSRVFFISPSVNNNTQSILVKALYNNLKGELRADQFARAKVIWSQRPGVLIPAAAVSRLAGETFVFVAQTGDTQQNAGKLIARQKPVKLGNIKGNNYQVIEGLAPGERIITSGILNLRDGIPIVATGEK